MEQLQEEARVEKARQYILAVLEARFGSPGPEVTAALNAITESARLDRVHQLALQCSGLKQFRDRLKKIGPSPRSESKVRGAHGSCAAIIWPNRKHGASAVFGLEQSDLLVDGRRPRLIPQDARGPIYEMECHAFSAVPFLRRREWFERDALAPVLGLVLFRPGGWPRRCPG